MAEKLSTGFVNALLATGSVTTVMANFVIYIYSGTQPATADDTEGAAVFLLKLTKDGAAFSSGSATNGLNFGSPTDGVLPKNGDTWKGTGLAAAGTGTAATWFRAYANTVVTGASTTAVRYDGAVGNSAAFEMFMSNTIIAENGVSTVNTYTFTLPRS